MNTVSYLYLKAFLKTILSVTDIDASVDWTLSSIRTFIYITVSQNWEFNLIFYGKRYIWYIQKKMGEFPNGVFIMKHCTALWEQFNLSNQLKHVVSTSSNLFFPVLLWRKEITYKCIFNALLTQLWLPLIEKKVDICYIHHSYCIFCRHQCGSQNQ